MQYCEGVLRNGLKSQIRSYDILEHGKSTRSDLIQLLLGVLNQTLKLSFLEAF